MIRTTKKQYAKESSLHDDKLKAFLQFNPMIDESQVSIRSTRGYDGPVTEITFNGSVFWILTEAEAQREATASFLEHYDGSTIESDPDLRRIAERDYVLDMDFIAEMWEGYSEEYENGEDEPDNEGLAEWARNNYSIEELWDNGMIDHDRFCDELWEGYGYGSELDIEQHLESEIVGGYTFYIFLREGEWDVVLESRGNRHGVLKRRVEKVSKVSTGFERDIEELDKAMEKAGSPVEITLSDSGIAEFWMNERECRVVLRARNGNSDDLKHYDISVWHYPKNKRVYVYNGPSDMVIGNTDIHQLCEIILNLSAEKEESRKQESSVSDAEYRRSVADEVCEALNIATSDHWEVIEEPGDTFVTIRSDNEDCIIDGTFCEVEVTNNWVSCFAYPTREGGDYVLIGRFRCLDRNLLDKVTALDGCGAECSIESRCKQIRKCEDSLDSLRSDMSDALIADLKVAWKAGNHRAEVICLNHRSEIAALLTKYGMDMYDTEVSFYDFRGGYDSLARDILLCADILTENDLYSEKRSQKSSGMGRRRYESREVYSPAHAARAKELAGLRDQELQDALQVGDILTGAWGYNRTITEWFIVKRKTAKRVVVHKLTRTQGGQSGDSMGGWTTCPNLPPEENPRDKDIQGIVRYDYVKISDYPEFLSVWDGTYGWENYD